jgi:putative glutamine amidotransferase
MLVSAEQESNKIDADVKRPRIGIPLPTTGDAEYNQRSWPQYASAVASAGGEAIQLPVDLPAPELAILSRTCDGYVLPGSPADVEPQRYGQAKEGQTASADHDRETCDHILLDDAASTGKPVLGVCYGLQSMNVWRGGTLVQDLDPVPVNHSAGRQVAVAHSVRVASASLLGSLLTAAEAPAEDQFRKLPVNSSHHQAVAVPGEDLSIVARSAQDAVIEALEGRIGRAAMIGVQWHPERSVDISPASRALFAWLVAEAFDSQGFQGEGSVADAP